MAMLIPPNEPPYNRKHNTIYFLKSRAFPKWAFIICTQPTKPTIFSKNQDYSPHGHLKFSTKTKVKSKISHI